MCYMEKNVFMINYNNYNNYIILDIVYVKIYCNDILV